MKSLMFSVIKRFSSSSHRRWLWTAIMNSKDKSIVLNQVNDELKFPSVWLRDNCQCEHCFNTTVQSRSLTHKQFKSTESPRSLKILNEAKTEFLEVIWSDQHVSCYTLDWLKERSFDEKSQEKWLKYNYIKEKVTWNASNFNTIIKYYSFDSLMKSDDELLMWLLSLTTEGIAIIKEAGTDESRLEMLAQRVGYLKRTVYGRTFRVEAKDDATNAAYLPTDLQLHTDLPQYEYSPGVNILHYVTQTVNSNEGGNQLTDGLEVCRQLKNYDAEMYDILKNTHVEWFDVGREGTYDYDHRNHGPVICENDYGDIIKLNFSQTQRDSHLCVSIDQANKWYQAMNWFINFAYNSKNVVNLKMKQGDMLSFDNQRILHGRTGYSGNRCLIGGYLDWDIVKSMIRALRTKCHKRK